MFIPSLGLGLLSSTIPREVRHQYIAFVAATLLAASVIYVLAPSLKVAEWWLWL